MIAIAMSGGLDSLAAACLLKEQGEKLIGIHFITGYNQSKTEIDKVYNAAESIGIPFKIIDCADEFQSQVVDYFINAYKKNLTPNPCIVCNTRIKFKILLDYAIKLGASHLATGHYVRTRQDKNGIFHLLKGKDFLKDQSYFLAFLNQYQLGHAVFPLGEWTKDKVRSFALEKGLSSLHSKESQEVCFIKEGSYSDFLLKQPGFNSSPGPIVDINGKVLGQHQGLHAFTIGQRRGINCPAAHPYYVVKLDRKNNTLVVGSRDNLFSDKCKVSQINWIQPALQYPNMINIKVRYRSKETQAKLIPTGEDTALIEFYKLQSAVTPGQAAVFYKENEVLGGGILI
ncbi:tRNA-specific 2-thiouridylase MnmA [Candidatus Magnetomoraceae bacterium gMMP-1]